MGPSQLLFMMQSKAEMEAAAKRRANSGKPISAEEKARQVREYKAALRAKFRPGE